MTILIGIPSFKRPLELHRLLESLSENLPKGRYSVVVIDNDPNRSAAPIVEKHHDQLDISYDVEENPGVVHVRNRILNIACKYDALVFLDDDEWISPNWADAIEAALVKFPDAVLAGPVRYILPEDAPSSFVNGGFYHRKEHVDGSLLKSTGTGNSCIPKSVLNLLQGNGFDPAFARIGGEDTELFMRLVKQGTKIRWVSAAVVFESVSSEEVNLQAASRRFRRVGMVNALLNQKSNNIIQKVTLTALRLIIGMAKYSFRKLLKRPIRAKDISTLYSGLGHLDVIRGRSVAYYGEEETDGNA